MRNVKILLTVAATVAGVTAAEAQSTDRMKELLQEMELQIDSIESLLTVKPQPVAPISNGNGSLAIDTLDTANDAVKVVLFNDNTWRYVHFKSEDDWNVENYTEHWDTVTLFPYNDVKVADLPRSIAIELVDSLKSYHYPIKGTVRSRYGARGRRRHCGVDIPLKTGDPIYATFSGKVRISSYNKGGYGNLVIIRHDNGLETWHGHLSERMVKAGDTVHAGQIIGLGGDTGRSTGPHLHYEMRYSGQPFDPERLINFQTGDLRRDLFLLKRSYFDVNSRAGLQDFEDEELGDKEIAEEAKKQAAAKEIYHKIKSGDTLGGLALRYGVSIDKICRLNGITRKTVLRIGRTLRIN